MLLAQEPNAVDHLLGPVTRSGQTLGESGILPLQELNALG